MTENLSVLGFCFLFVRIRLYKGQQVMKPAFLVSHSVCRCTYMHQNEVFQDYGQS